MATTQGIDQIKQGMRSTWIAGDFGMIAKNMEYIATQFALGMGIPAGATVLDVATGTGNVAIPLARAGCIVTGVDIAPNLLEQARGRALAEGLSAQFDEGDAEALPYPDASFDAVVTMYGAMFAPRPELVAKELARVLKPGGLLGMANWNPESFTGKMFRAGSMHVPPPPGVLPPVLWGDDATVRQRLAEGFTDIHTELIPIDFDMPGDVAATVDLFRTYFGPTKIAFSKLDESGQDALYADLIKLWSEHNVAEDPTTRTLVKNEYRKVTAKKR
ncbi:MAG: class I SAM-dependent methyltransferase [Terriglobus sp.]